MSTFSTSSRQKRLKPQNPQFFTLLTSKCASRHNGVHFFDTFSTSEPPKVVRDRQFLTLLTWMMCFAPQRRALFRHLNFQKWSEPGVVLYILTSKCASRHNVNIQVFEIRSRVSISWCCCCGCCRSNVLVATTACTFSTSQLPKVVRPWCVLYILTSKCASRHNGVHFFDISTSKSGPKPSVFNTFDFEMCFAPQRRALFRHLNFQKWSDAGVFCTF